MKVVKTGVIAALASCLVLGSVTAGADEPRGGAQSSPTRSVRIRFVPETFDLILVEPTGVEIPPQTRYDFRRVTYYEGGGELYRHICDGACDVELEVGTYHFGLRKAGRDVVLTDPVVIEAPATITTSYTDLSAIRYAGLGIGIGGALVGVGLVVGGIASSGSSSVSELGAAGAVTVLVSAVVGLALGLQRDHAQIRLGAPPSPSRRAGALQGTSLAIGF